MLGIQQDWQRSWLCQGEHRVQKATLRFIPLRWKCTDLVSIWQEDQIVDLWKVLDFHPQWRWEYWRPVFAEQALGRGRQCPRTAEKVAGSGSSGVGGVLALLCIWWRSLMELAACFFGVWVVHWDSWSVTSSSRPRREHKYTCGTL